MVPERRMGVAVAFVNRGGSPYYERTDSSKWVSAKYAIAPPVPNKLKCIILG